jgi:diguanylate cyclase (GGDEF)-like protein
MFKPTSQIVQRTIDILKLPSVAFGLAAIMALWWGAFMLIDIERAANRRSIESDVTNLSRVFEQNVIRSLSEVDKSLLYLRHAHARSNGPTDWSTLINQAFTASAITFQLAVIDASGKLVASDRGPQPPAPIDLSDRDHFRVHAYMPGDTIYISKPVLGRVSKQWSVQITRRITNADGSFGGVIVASLDPEHFSAFYRAIDLGSGGAVMLIGLDGTVRASGGLKAERLGVRLTEPEIVSRIREERAATFAYLEALTGQERIAAMRWVEGYPLAVVVATDEHQPSGSWKREPRFYLAACALMSLMIAAALFAIVRRSLRLAEARRQLKLKKLQHEVTLENMTQGILMVDGSGEIGFMNARLGELLGLGTDFAGERRTYRDLVEYLERRGEFDGTIDADLLEFIRFPETRDLIPHYERERPDGTVLEVRSKALPEGGFVRTLTDITGRRRAEAKVLQLARHDALTGLSNRAVFRQQLEEAASLTTRGRHFAVLMIDLDRFKPVNDTYGHAVGDLLLKLVAERLRTVVRGGDVIGRLGGDEFAVIQMGTNQAEQAEALARRISRSLCQPYSIDGQTITIGASVGIALAPRHGASAQELLHAADLALYSVKAGHRGSHAVFNQQMHEEHCARRKLEEDLRRAIDEGQFELHYQPILSIGANEVTAYEALIRWHHPERGNVPPLDFIPLAEETGLIGPIGAWVLQQACADISQREGSARVAINLSPVQFRDHGLVDMVVNALEASGLPANRLEIEITESALLQDCQLTQRHLAALRELGVHITMDDFGTGYSSLSYLLSYPIQSLKIDRSFVQGLGEQPNPTAIVKTITTLATSLGLSTTAEGVETEQQLQFLRELGCTEAQGYYFSKPKPAAEILPPRSVPAAQSSRKRNLRFVG